MPRYRADGRRWQQQRLPPANVEPRQPCIKASATIFVTIDGVAKPKEIQYWTDGEYLIARDKAYDVTVRLAPGKMEDEGWFW